MNAPRSEAGTSGRAVRFVRVRRNAVDGGDAIEHHTRHAGDAPEQGRIEGVPGHIGEVAALDTVREALALWTQSGASRDEAFEALCAMRVGEDGADEHAGPRPVRLAYEDVAHAAAMARLDAAYRAEGRTPERGIDENRTLMEAGLGAGARLAWTLRETRTAAENHPPGQSEESAEEHRARRAYSAQIEREAGREPRVQVPGERRATWAEHALVESGQVLARSGEHMIIERGRALLAGRGNERSGAVALGSARAEARMVGTPEAERFIESAADIGAHEAERDARAGDEGTRHAQRAQARHTWLGTAIALARDGRGRPLDAHQCEKAERLGRNAIRKLGGEVSFGRRGALLGPESVASALEREGEGTDPAVVRIAVRAAGTILPDASAGCAEVRVREAMIKEAEARTSARGQAQAAARVHAERALRAARAAQRALRAGGAGPRPDEAVEMLVRSVAERGDGGALAQLAEAAEREAAGKATPNTEGRLTSVLRTVWQAQDGAPERMKTIGERAFARLRREVEGTPAAAMRLDGEGRARVLDALAQGAREASVHAKWDALGYPERSGAGRARA